MYCDDGESSESEVKTHIDLWVMRTSDCLLPCYLPSSLLPFSPPSPSLFPFPIPFFLSSLPSF